MSEELKKQIEICETIVEQGCCTSPAYINCIGCPLDNGDGYDCNNHDNDTVMASKSFLAKHKPPITKEELIEACKGKVFKCESQEEWDLCVEKIKSLGIKPWADYTKGGNSGFAFCHFDKLFMRRSEGFNSTGKDFLSLFTSSVTIAKGYTAIDNPSVEPKKLPNPDLTTKLNKREMILKNKKDVVEVCDKALVCYAPEGHELCRFDGNLYRPAQGLNPSDMVKLANWILNLEKAVK